MIPIQSKPVPNGSPAAGKLTVSKNYVIPPRPKPGRKPSLEAPPSKRKAQNRESQRAYRERKAIAVKELETQLAQQAQRFDEQQKALQKQIDQLRNTARNATQLPSISAPGSPTALHLMNPSGLPPNPSIPQSTHHLTGYPGNANFTTYSPYHTLPPFFSLGSPGYQLDPKQQPPLSPLPLSPLAFSPPFATPMSPADVVGMELLDHVLDQKLPVTPNNTVAADGNSARSPASGSSTESTSPSNANSTTPTSSRIAPSPRLKEPKRTEIPTSDPLELMKSEWSQPAKPLNRANRQLETDFTNKFRSVPRPLISKSDKCGFCTGGNVCVCAEAALRESGDFIDETDRFIGSPLSSSVSVTPRSPNSDGTPPDCSGDPGKCDKCAEDPMLSLFCSALSSKEKTPSTGNGTFISPLQAYKTLKRHPKFSVCDLGDVISELAVGISGQVDVGSIARCLRKLD